MGGTSGDFSKFDATQQDPIVIPSGLSQNRLHHPILGMTLGPSYFDSFQNFPGQRWTFQMQFASSTDSLSTNALDQAKAAISSIGLDNLASLELGNEPNEYINFGLRPKTFVETDYVRQSLAYIKELRTAISGLPQDVFQALALATGNNFAKWNV